MNTPPKCKRCNQIPNHIIGIPAFVFWGEDGNPEVGIDVSEINGEIELNCGCEPYLYDHLGRPIEQPIDLTPEEMYFFEQSLEKISNSGDVKVEMSW